MVLDNAINTSANTTTFPLFPNTAQANLGRARGWSAVDSQFSKSHGLPSSFNSEITATSVFQAPNNDSLITGDGSGTIFADTGKDIINAQKQQAASSLAKAIKSSPAAPATIPSTPKQATTSSTAQKTTTALQAGLGNNRVVTGSGNDFVTAGDGNNQMYTDQGYDNINASEGDKLIKPGNGNDAVSVGNGSDQIVLEAGVSISGLKQILSPNKA